MRIVMFYHSLVSDRNHGNAHFLRGVTTELLARGHVVRVLEPAGGWSRTNLPSDHGERVLAQFYRASPQLPSETYDPSTLDLGDVLRDADLVLVHEWNTPELIAAVGRHH